MGYEEPNRGFLPFPRYLLVAPLMSKTWKISKEHLV